MTGNPCESWKNLKDYIIAKIPQLRRFNGTDILKSERIKATQILPDLEKELSILAKENIEKKLKEPQPEGGYTPESRSKMYKDLMEKQQKDEEEKKKSTKTEYIDNVEKLRNEPPSVYNNEGEIRQCNQGKYKFKFLDNWDDENIIFEIYVPKFLDTSLIKVDLNPLYVRLDIKGKITQIKFSEEIVVEKSKSQRSTTTGALQITCPKLNFDPKLKERKKTKEAAAVASSPPKKIEEIKKQPEPIKLAHLLKKGEKEEELLKVFFLVFSMIYRKFLQFH